MTLKKIRSFDDILTIQDKSAPIVTLFSGGLDSSYLLSYLYEAGFSQVYALCVDLGDDIDRAQLVETAQQFNANLVIEDQRETFANEYVAPALKAHACYLKMFPISSSLARPLIAQVAVQLGKRLNATAVLHTANLSQNSLRRLNTAIRASGFNGLYGSPYEYSALSRDDKATALARYGLSYYTGRKLSGDANLWCREFESGPLDNPEIFAVSDADFSWSMRKEDLKPLTVTLAFTQGNLSHVNGKRMVFQDAIVYLNAHVGQFGHGRFVGLEHLDHDEKVLEVREAPAAFILMQALRHIEVATLSTKSIAMKQTLEQAWTLEAVEGRWKSDTKDAAEAGILALAKRVTGEVRFNVSYEFCLPESIRADNPLYLTDRDNWEIKHSQMRSARSIRDFENALIPTLNLPAEEKVA